MARTSRCAAIAVFVVAVALTGVTVRSNRADADVGSGISFLASAQGSNGGWDASPAGEFVTSEAVLAIASAAQTSTTWSTVEGRTAALAFDDDVSGLDPIDFMDDAAEGSLTPGKAAKFIVNVVAPLGYDPADFDPVGDSAAPVDLAAAVGSPNLDGSFGAPGFFSETLYAALAKYAAGGSVPAATVAYVRAAQQSGGGFAYDADPTGATTPDVDMTALAVEALVAAGAGATDPDVREAIGYLAGAGGYDNATGHWIAFGSPSPESTGRAAVALSAAGYDVASSCWRDTAAVGLAGTAYLSPDAAVLALQSGDGGWGSFFRPYSTAQAIQGLTRAWRPIARAAPSSCPQLGGITGGAPAAVGVAPTFTG